MMFCVVMMMVVGLLGVEVLLAGLGLSAVARIWFVAGKGLPGVYFVKAGT